MQLWASVAADEVDLNEYLYPKTKMPLYARVKSHCKDHASNADVRLKYVIRSSFGTYLISPLEEYYLLLIA